MGPSKNLPIIRLSYGSSIGVAPIGFATAHGRGVSGLGRQTCGGLEAAMGQSQ